MSASRELVSERRIVADFPSISAKRALTMALFVTGVLTLQAGVSLLGAAFGLDWMPLRFTSEVASVVYGASFLVSGAFATAAAVRQRKRWNALEHEARDRTILRAAFGDDPSRSRSR